MNDQGQQTGISLASGLRSEGIVLAITPFFGSVVALMYEVGYLSFFDVPANFIQLDFVRIVTASSIVAFFFASYLVALSLAGLVVQGRSPLRRALALPLSAAFVLAPIILLTPGPPGRWLVLAGLMLFSILGCFVTPMFSRRSGKTYMQRLSEEMDNEELARNDQGAKDASSIYNKIFFPLSMLFFVTFAIFSLGRNAAAEATTHWVTKGDQAWLFVRSYGDKIILKSFEPSTKQIGSELRLLAPDNSAASILIRRDTGKLLAPKKIGVEH